MYELVVSQKRGIGLKKKITQKPFWKIVNASDVHRSPIKCVKKIRLNLLIFYICYKQNQIQFIHPLNLL